LRPIIKTKSQKKNGYRNADRYLEDLRDLEESDPYLLNYRNYEQEDYGESIDVNTYYKKMGNKYRQMYLNM
jgi:hypothetical protein